MNPVNHAPCHGTGSGQLDRLSQNTIQRPPPDPKQHGCPRCLDAASSDPVRLSYQARENVTARSIDPPQPGSPGGDSDLAATVRKVGQFFHENPAIVHSPFGKSVRTLMSGAARLVKAYASVDDDGFPPSAQQRLRDVVLRVTEFLRVHHRVADSPFGQAVAELAESIVSAIGDKGADPDIVSRDGIVEAAGQAQAFLAAHPGIAALPLGQTVERLIGGIQGTAEANGIDFDSRILAQRVDHFVAQHPRLANSEFGHLVAALTRGMMAADANRPQHGEPTVAGDAVTDAAVPVVSDPLPGTRILEEADLKEAA